MSENSHVSNTKRKVKQEKGESKNEEEKKGGKPLALLLRLSLFRCFAWFVTFGAAMG